MRIGKTMRRVWYVLEALGSEHGRPPSMAEIREMLSDVDQSNITKALRSLQGYALVQLVGHGHYVLLRTLDGRPVTFAQQVGLVEPRAD